MKNLVLQTVPLSPAINQRFQEILPQIRRCAEFAFRTMKAEEQEEAVQDVVVQSFFAFSRLVRQGRMEEVFPTVLVRFAVRRYRTGRRASGPVSQRDLSLDNIRKTDRRGRRDSTKPRRCGRWREMLVEDRRTPIPDQVSFRVDFPAWLSRLSPHQRRVAEMFAAGDRLADVARGLDVSKPRVSQIRQKLHDAWQEFQQEMRPATTDLPHAS